MSQDYVHACERAELLGLPIPTEEEWKETQKAQSENQGDPENDITQDLNSSDETAQRIGGRLDELNSILSVTQKKINRFKTVCGSLGSLLKVKVGSRNNTPNHKAERARSADKGAPDEAPLTDEKMTVELTDDDGNPTTEEAKPENGAGNPVTPKKIDLNQKLGSHLDKLDSLITKAENAQYSMQHQSKQMRKFLK